MIFDLFCLSLNGAFVCVCVSMVGYIEKCDSFKNIAAQFDL